MDSKNLALATAGVVGAIGAALFMRNKNDAQAEAAQTVAVQAEAVQAVAVQALAIQAEAIQAETNFLNQISLGADEQVELGKAVNDTLKVLNTKPFKKYLKRVNRVTSALDKNNDGGIDVNEIKDIDTKGTLMAKADSNNDGMLSAHEFKCFLDEKANMDLTSFVKYLVWLETKLGVTKSQKQAAKNLRNNNAHRHRVYVLNTLKAKFHEYDKDGDGVLDEAELLALVAAVETDADKELARVMPKDCIPKFYTFQAADWNNDGKVDKSELLSMVSVEMLLLQKFQEADVDGDGSLCRYEWKALIHEDASMIDLLANAGLDMAAVRMCNFLDGLDEEDGEQFNFFEGVDSDNNDNITFDEFMKALYVGKNKSAKGRQGGR